MAESTISAGERLFTDRGDPGQAIKAPIRLPRPNEMMVATKSGPRGNGPVARTTGSIPPVPERGVAQVRRNSTSNLHSEQV